MAKLLASDFDCTFYLNDEDMEQNKLFVNKFMELGNLFVIATGRSYSAFQNVLNRFQFNYNYVILNHGSTIVDKDGQILFNTAIPNEILPCLEKDLELDTCEKFFCCSGVESGLNFTNKDLSKIHVKYDSEERSLQMANIINQKHGDYVTAYFMNTDFIEIISNKTSKANAIYKLIEHCGKIDKSNVYTIGDSYSDMEMVGEFNGFCVRGSVPELKAIANAEYSSVSLLLKDIIEGKR